MQLAGLKCVITVLAAWATTAMVLSYALARNVVDVPNHRSSHTQPTPRGGGVALLLCFLAGVAWGPHGIDSVGGLPVVVAGLAVGGVGFLDDHAGIRARWRFMVHILSAATCTWSLFRHHGPVPYLAADAVAWALAILFLAWMINLYNFMDGINGIAGVEAVTVGLGGVVLAAVSGKLSEQGMAPLFLAAAALGFLFWNFPVARIFLGDAGSGFIGLMLGIFALRAGLGDLRDFVAWNILLGCFTVDATMTLVRRIATGKAFYKAHRDHAYQHAAKANGSHTSVTLVLGAINLFWLLPIAVFVAQARLGMVVGSLLALLPLVALAMRYEAGVNKDEAGAPSDG